MEKERIGTVVKVGSSSLYCPETYQPYLESFGRMAAQLRQVGNSSLISSGAYLAGKKLDPEENDTGYLTSIGWKQLLDQWESAFGEPMPSVLAEEIHFHQAVSDNGDYQPARFQHIVKTFVKAWEKKKTLITNQNDPVSKVGLAPEILDFEEGLPSFHGDNDLYASEITRALLKQKTLDRVNFIILSGGLNGITDEQGKTIPEVSVRTINEMMQNPGAASREGANGFRTKGTALLRAHEAGAEAYLGSSQSKSCILEAAGLKTQTQVTKVISNLTEV
ncbi:hypothetical protein GW756_02940 [bacterium]|nr:hypothetical protein [bacterium]NCQ55526.1 hypothetical protein [Candidatus Parcubacteria bacterium]NCS67537.1 hypothetical protein [Candidatus Peregrinibacteria bacterium]NCS96298.1 hypothetical protein [bacterium]